MGKNKSKSFCVLHCVLHWAITFISWGFKLGRYDLFHHFVTSTTSFNFHKQNQECVTKIYFLVLVKLEGEKDCWHCWASGLGKLAKIKIALEGTFQSWPCQKDPISREPISATDFITTLSYKRDSTRFQDGGERR